MQPLYATMLSYPKQYATALGNRLWKRYVTAYGNGMQPLYTTMLSYPKQYATALGNRLWKRYVTTCLVTYPVMQPLMETVLVLPKSLEPLHLFSRNASQYQ
jgi:hypothetical protein